MPYHSISDLNYNEYLNEVNITINMEEEEVFNIANNPADQLLLAKDDTIPTEEYIASDALSTISYPSGDVDKAGNPVYIKLSDTQLRNLANAIRRHGWWNTPEATKEAVRRGEISLELRYKVAIGLGCTLYSSDGAPLQFYKEEGGKVYVPWMYKGLFEYVADKYITHEQAGKGPNPIKMFGACAEVPRSMRVGK